MKIAFFDTKPYDRKSFDHHNETFQFKIKYFKAHLTLDTIALTKGYDVVSIFVNDTVTQEMIDQLYNNGVRLLALRCAGYNHVDIKAAYGKIHVVRVPAYSPHAIAEHTAALMLSLNRKIHRAYFRTRDANFALNGLMGFNFYQKTAGVIGTGRIGRALISILNGFGMRVIAYDKYPNKEAAVQERFEYVTLPELFQQSHIISLNCPLTSETEYMINRDTIAAMKEGVMLVNTGRGKLIDTKALIDGLKSGQVGSAGLDVYEEESDYFFEDHSNKVLNDDTLARLLTFNNVIVTSHQAFFTKEAVDQITLITLSNIKVFSEGPLLENEVCYRCDHYPDTCLKKVQKPCFE